MVIFREVSAYHTTYGQHKVMYEIDFDGKKLADFVRKAFIESEHYPFKIPYGDLQIVTINGKVYLVHDYDTSD